MDESQSRFIELLKQESSALEDFYDLLIQELGALKDRDSDKITKLAEEKGLAMNKLAMLDKQRQLYIESDEHTQYPDYSFANNIDTLNSEIQTSLDRCRHQNNINGGIIEMSQLFNKKILDIVCGNIDKEMTYSAEGKSNSGNNQHSLAHV